MQEKTKKQEFVPPTKIKQREHLNADALFENIYEQFGNIPEIRSKDSKIEISIADALMSGFAMFSLKVPSLLQFDNKRKDPAECENLKNIYGIQNIPCDSRMREICDEIEPDEYISPIFKVVFRHLQRGKILEPMAFYNGHYLLNLDGTGFFSSKKISSPYCMEKINKKTGEVTYHLQTLGAAIVNPDFKEVIPLCPEMISKQDGTTKNDCERNAAKRFFEQLRKDHPKLPLIINEDALSPNAPHIKELKRYNLRFILCVKPGDHDFLFNFVDDAVKNNRTNEFEFEDKDNSDVIHRFQILNQVPLNRSNQDVLVNFIQYWEYSKKADKVTYHDTWVTDFTLTEKNAYTIMRGGRARWKIENETFNTLKNQGYNLGHNYGLGKQYLSTIFVMLMMLAFLVDQIQQLCSVLFRSVWNKLGSKKALWESIRAYFKSFIVKSMEEILIALLYGITAQPLEEVINSYDSSQTIA
ncbi:MAG: transposase [Desulfobacterales bacterium]|nr:transposase [Desulfobacterales bacterium]